MLLAYIAKELIGGSRTAGFEHIPSANASRSRWRSIGKHHPYF